ncbi:diacylglycerol/lipid kinase family protein [Spirillospora sp. CA-128828]|uniref:diacylglycerol/lipid kinase family protein n=1 Tax=Spirillospora sp. CA-128828 TaxID=3240033 RepID=UPI003D8B4151
MARLSLASGGAAVLTLLLAAGFRSLVLLGAGLAGLVVTAAALWWVLTRRALVRVLAGALAVAMPLAVALYYVALGLLWVVLLSAGLWALAVGAGRAALRTGVQGAASAPYPAPPPAQPFLIMNPRSGGGKVERFRLADKARELGAHVVVLDPDHHRDVAELARRAVADGADLLGVAGGDGTQALVAEVAARHGVPFMVIAAGTRNQAVLVSNNPYQGGDPAGLGRRERLESGVLGVLAVSVDSAAQAAGLLRGRRGPGLTALTTDEVTVDADAAEIPVGVDGETLTLPTPVTCRIQAAALRVRVPRHRRRALRAKPMLDWRSLNRLAFTRGSNSMRRRA